MEKASDTLRLLDAAAVLLGTENQSAAARLFGITDQTLTNWKSRGVPSAELLRLAEIVKVNPYWIRDGDPKPRRIIYTHEMAHLFEVAEKLPPPLLQALTRQAIYLLNSPKGKPRKETDGND